MASEFHTRADKVEDRLNTATPEQLQGALESVLWVLRHNFDGSLYRVDGSDAFGEFVDRDDVLNCIEAGLKGWDD